MTIDPFAYTTLQANGAGGTMSGGANGLGSGANGFVNSAIRFDPPNSQVSPLQPYLCRAMRTISIRQSGMPVALALSFFPGGLGRQGNTGGRNGDFDGQAAAKYHADFMGMGFDVFGGYSRDNANGTQKSLGLKTEEVWRVGAAWAWENFKFIGQYEHINHAIGSATCTTAAALVANPLAAGSSGQCNSAMNWGGDGNIWHAGGQYRWGNTTLVAQGGMTNAHAGGINASAARKAQSFTVGAIHNLSKRTSIFGGYQHVYVTNANGAAQITWYADQYVAPGYATGKVVPPIRLVFAITFN